jgi:ribosome-associated translation inhibitor RaiA
MQVPLNIVFRHMEKSDAVEERIIQKLDKLEDSYGEIISCNVVIEQVNKNQNQGRLFNIRINLNLPKKEIVITHQKDEDLFVVVRDALNSLTHKIEAHFDKLKNLVKDHEEVLHGQVSKLFEHDQYGFILSDNNDEYYFSATNLHGCDFDHLKLGDAVKFIEVVAQEGLQANRVSLKKHD